MSNLYLLNTSNLKLQDTKSTESKAKKLLEAKWNQIISNVNNLTAKISEAQGNLHETEIEDLTDIRNQLSECEKSLNHFTTEVYSISWDEDPDGDNWNDTNSTFFNKINPFPPRASVTNQLRFPNLISIFGGKFKSKSKHMLSRFLDKSRQYNAFKQWI